MNFEDLSIIIPSRIGSSRLKNKPLSIVGESTLIELVYKQARKTNINVYVATDSEEISSVIKNIGGNVIMTSENCQTGTERVFEAYKKLSRDNENTEIRYIINLQGDMPFIDPISIISAAKLIKSGTCDISTLAIKTSKEKAIGESNAKIVVDDYETEFPRAVYFSRNMIPHNADYFLYHLGIYGFTTNSLNKFCSLPRSYLEECEKLEQLRILNTDMQIRLCYVKDIPISVDTQEDLDKARNHFYSKER